MYYLGARYYDPEIGRFISADDVTLLSASLMALTDKNLYAYCDNNPVTRKDAEGNIWIETLMGSMAVGAAVGFVTGAAISAISQKITTGTIDRNILVNDSVAGALSGALAVTNVGKVGQVLGNAVISVGNYLASEGENATKS